MSNTGGSYKRMYVGRGHAREQWTDILGWHPGTVTIDKRGYGIFPVFAMRVGVWVNSAAEGRESLEMSLYVVCHSPFHLLSQCTLSSN
jgi:alpha-amylase